MSIQSNRAALFGSKASGNGTGNRTAAPAAAKPAAAVVEAPPPVSKTAGMKSTLPSGGIPGLSAETRRKRAEEVKQLLERASAALKTSVFQWSPDYLVASSLFEQAADIQKQLGETESSMEYYGKAGHAHEMIKAQASAALAYTKAAVVASDIDDVKRACGFYQQAADCWAAHGEIPRYGETLHKIAKLLESRSPKKATEFHWQAVRALVPPNTSQEVLKSTPAVVLDMLRHVFSFFVKQKALQDALAVLDTQRAVAEAFELEPTVHKCMLYETVLQVALGDQVRAQQRHLEHFSLRSYLASKECELADLLMTALGSQDADSFDAVRQHVQMEFLDRDVVQLIRSWNLFDLLEGGGTTASQPAPKPSTTQEGRSQLFGKTQATAPVPEPTSEPVSTAVPASPTPPTPPTPVPDAQPSSPSTPVVPDHNVDEDDELDLT